MAVLPAASAAYTAAKDSALVLAGGIPNPTGVQPPGTEGLATILNWVFWIITVLCVLGVLMVAGAMAIAHRRGEGDQHMSKLGWVMGACVLAGAASSLVTTLV